MKTLPLKIVVMGFGGRGESITQYAIKNPHELVVAAVVEPSAERQKVARNIFGENLAIFSSSAEFYESDVDVDGVWVVSKENAHTDLAVEAMQRKLPLICEKPLATTIADTYRICNAYDANPVPFVIPHSLRYLPSYRKIKQIIEDGSIGRIMHIHAMEEIGDRHTVSYYRRGPGRLRKDTKFLMAKSSHDLDIINWMMGGVKVKSIACFGGQDFFKPRPGVPDRCTSECPELSTCPFGPEWQHPGQPKKSFKVDDDTLAVVDEKRCAWNSGSDQIDHQTLIMQYEDGTTVDFTLRCFGGGGRPMQITGSEGTIFNHKQVQLTKYHPLVEQTFAPADLPPAYEGPHGGGDWGLIKDWIEAVSTGSKPKSATVHEAAEAIVLCEAADLAMLENRLVDVEELRKAARLEAAK